MDVKVISLVFASLVKATGKWRLGNIFFSSKALFFLALINLIWTGNFFMLTPKPSSPIHSTPRLLTTLGLIYIIKQAIELGFCGEQKGGNALCFLNERVEGLSAGKHAYCIVKWLLISPACFNLRDTTVAFHQLQKRI